MLIDTLPSWRVEYLWYAIANWGDLVVWRSRPFLKNTSARDQIQGSGYARLVIWHEKRQVVALPPKQLILSTTRLLALYGLKTGEENRAKRLLFCFYGKPKLA